MPVIDPQKDYYAILEVPVEADVELIKKVYRDRARQYHPDSGRGDAARFRAIHEAYEILGDATLRRAYDQQRVARGLSQESPLKLELFQNVRQLPVLDMAQMFYVMLDLQVKKELEGSRRRLNLALVIDRSTSMRGVRMQNVKIAAQDLLRSLQAEDRLAIVAFSDRAEVLAPSEYVRNVPFFNSAIAALNPGGGTEIYRGLLAGLEQLRAGMSSDSINHVILLTDGRTYGDEEFALTEARRAAAEGLGISALGIGEDWNDAFLDRLAQYGGGVSQYIHSPSQLRSILRDHIQGLSSAVARRVQLRANLAPYVHLRAVQRAAPYMEVLESTPDHVVSLGNLTVGEPLSVVWELTIDRQDAGERRILRFDLEAEDSASSTPIVMRRDVTVTFAPDVEPAPVPPRLLNALQRLSVFQLQERAWHALESGDSRRATQFLEAAATQLFNMGYRELGQAAMLEVGRISQGGDPTGTGRKKLRYGTRALSIPSA